MTDYNFNPQILRIIKNNDLTFKYTPCVLYDVIKLVNYLYDTHSLEWYIIERKKSISHNNEKLKFNEFFCTISFAFNWDRTPQSYQFWYDLHKNFF